MQIYRLILPVWIFKNFLFLSGAWDMVSAAFVGLWFVYGGRGGDICCAFLKDADCELDSLCTGDTYAPCIEDLLFRNI